MKIPTFHDNGELFSKVSAQIFIKKPVRPVDSLVGYGYSIQLNTSNPLVEYNTDTNTWIPRNPSNGIEYLAFQQNCLQNLQIPHYNQLLFWNRNALLNQIQGRVEFGVTIMPDEIWEAFQHFGEKDSQCVQLDIDLTGFRIVLYDYFLKVIYEAKSFPQRWVQGFPTTYKDVPITPWTFFQLRIVGYGDLSRSTFTEDAEFGIHITTDKPFRFNLASSAKTFQENWNLYTIGGVFDNSLYTGETSNLSCSLIDNDWFGNSLYYTSKVGI